MIKINIGCGDERLDGFYRVDKDRSDDPDKVIDLNKDPWPLKDNHYEYIYSRHTIEHLEDPNVFLKNIVRIAKNGAKFHIEYPHYSRGFAAPEHIRAYGSYLFEGLIMNINHKRKYGYNNFQIKSIRFNWCYQPELNNVVIRGINRVMSSIANKYPSYAERLMTYWMGGWDTIRISGTIKKWVA